MIGADLLLNLYTLLTGMGRLCSEKFQMLFSPELLECVLLLAFFQEAIISWVYSDLI